MKRLIRSTNEAQLFPAGRVRLFVTFAGGGGSAGLVSGPLHQPVPRTLSGSPPSVSAELHTAAEQHPEELCFCSSDMRLKVREQMPH